MLKQKTTLMLLAVWGMAILLIGCSDENPLGPDETPTFESGIEIEGDNLDQEFAEAYNKGFDIISQDGSEIPAEIAQVLAGNSSLEFWPYTATALSESPVDPINLVFKGQADPVQIRQALMSLDGDRTALGFPDTAPFNLPWTDAVGGDVQTTYLSDNGWEGCVIQLTLGEYTGLRVHLRLFATGLDDGQGGTWSLGGAHFEMMIPGTSEHQVLSWELAEQIVMADFSRTGLLGAYPAPTGLINNAPSFRGIPPFIYNPLVDDPGGQMLLSVLGYPLVYQDNDYPLPSDGQGTLLQLAGALPFTAQTYNNSVVIEYGQAIPRPVCNDGPYDWLYVTGPITFTTHVQVSNHGNYQYFSRYDGVLEAVPIDISTFEPIGLPFNAVVKGKQLGHTNDNLRGVKSFDMRLAQMAGQPEMLHEILSVCSNRRDRYLSFERCFDED